MNKTTKIILWAVIAAVLIGVLVWGIAGGISFNNAWKNFAGQFSDIKVGDFVENLPEDAQVGVKFEKPVNEIKEISMRFSDENITIIPTDEKVIRVEQRSRREIKEEDMMRYGVKNGELVVQSGRNGRIFGWWDSYPIDVEVMIPRSFVGQIDIQTVSGTIISDGSQSKNAVYATTSGDLTITDGNQNDLRIDSVSGEVDIRNTTAETLKINTTSGDMNMEGVFGEIKTNSVSGRVEIRTEKTREIGIDTTSGSVDIECSDAKKLEKISTNTISGDVSIMLPENNGFTLSYNTVSGSQSNGFAMKGNVYEDGGIAIGVSTTSGDLNIIEK